MMSRYKMKLWLGSHHPTLAITSLLVISLLLTRNCDVVNAVTIPSNDIDSRNSSSSNRNTLSDDAAVNPVLKSLDSTTNTISLKAQQLQLLRDKNFNGEDVKSVGGYAAEWEYLGNGLSGLAELDSPSETKLSPSEIASGRSKALPPRNPSPSPSRRLGPGSWLDSNGYWWLFGGQGPTANQTVPINYLSDLWVYTPPSSAATTTRTTEEATWRLVYRPDNDGEGPLSTHPEDVVFPLMCGSESSGRLALFKGQTNWPTSEKSTDSNSLFNEDGVVWISDIPRSLPSRRSPGKWSGGGGSGCSGQKPGPSGGGGIKQRCNDTQGLQWTSYICCDECLPDANSTFDFDFCPQFSQEPILWCNHDSLMAFSLNLRFPSLIKSKPKREISSSSARGKHGKTFSSTSTITTFISQTQIPKVSQHENFSEGEDESVAKMGEPILTLSHISLANATRVSMKNGSNSQGVGQPEKLIGGESTTTTKLMEGNETGDNKNMRMSTKNEGEQPLRGVQSGINEPEIFPTLRTTTATSEIISTPTIAPLAAAAVKQTEVDEEAENLLVNWWKFDLTLREWMKMPQVNMRPEEAEHLQRGNCRSVSDKHFLYILCPTKKNLLDRSVLLFDPTTSSIHSIGTIHLNNAFYDKKVWNLGLGRSVLHALRIDNQTVIFLAYHKLLDLWIHNHSSNQLTSVENVWKGASLHAFQHTDSFYKLSLVLSAPSSIDSEEEKQAPKKKTHSTIFYMVNPRFKLYSFQDPYPDGHFQITIVTDKSVFLPARDAPTLINASDDLPNKSESIKKENDQELDTISKTSLSFIKSNEKRMPEAEFSPQQKNDFKYDHRIHSQISITNPNPKPFIGESIQPGEGEEESHKQKDKTGWKTTEAGGGLPKSADLSSYMNKDSVVVVGVGNSRERDQVSSPSSSIIGMGKATRQATTFAEALSTAEENHETSQSKSNPGLSTLKNYNKTNNSPLKASVDVQVISGNKNTKRILGIKRPSIMDASKIDSTNSHPQPLPSSPISTTRIEQDIIGSGTRGRIGSSGGEDPANEMRSLAGPGSLPVNNESNKKPANQVQTTFTFGESQNHANSNSGGEPPEPRVLAVVKTDMQLTKMTSENSDHPSTTTFTFLRNATATNQRKSSGGGASVSSESGEEANFSKNGVNLSMGSSTPLEASVLKVASDTGDSSISNAAGKAGSMSLPANLETKTKPKNSSSWILPKSVNSSSSAIITTSTALEKERGGNHNHDHEHDEPNLENNYVSSRRRGKEWSRRGNSMDNKDVEKGLISHSGNESFMGDMAGGSGPLTYGSDEILIDSPSDQMQSISGEVMVDTTSSFGSLIFFSLSLSFFASFGLFVFVRRCVKCPPRSESVLIIKEPPPIRYSVVPDELSFHPHTPLV